MFIAYSTPGRGNEPVNGSFGPLDMISYGRHEAWDDKPEARAEAPQAGSFCSGPVPARPPWRLSGARATTTEAASGQWTRSI